MMVRVIPLKEGHFLVQDRTYDNFFVARAEARKIVRQHIRRERGEVIGSEAISSVLRDLRYDRILESS